MASSSTTEPTGTETFEFQTEARQLLDLMIHSVYSNKDISLGGSLIDAKVGDTRKYTVPSGATVTVTLVSAEPYHT